MSDERTEQETPQRPGIARGGAGLPLVENAPAQEVPEGAAVGTDPTEKDEAAPKGIVEGFLDLVKAVLTPQPKPVDPDSLSKDEYDRVSEVERETVAKILGGLVERFIDSMPRLVTIAASDQFFVITAGVDESPKRVVGMSPQRLRVRIINRGANDVFLGHSGSVSSSNGWTLAAAAGGGAVTSQPSEIELATRHEIWAVCASGDTSSVDILQEYET